MRREGRAVEGAILAVREIPTHKQRASGHFPINAVHSACECTQNYHQRWALYSLATVFWMSTLMFHDCHTEEVFVQNSEVNHIWESLH